MSVSASFTARDSELSIVDGFLAHPDFRTISAFFLGWVFLSSIQYLLCSPFLCNVIGVRLKPVFTPNPQQQADIEAHHPSEPQNAEVREDHATCTDFYDDACALVINICFAFAAIAQFGSLLDFGSHVGNTGCTFVIAWGSMAAYSARLVGLSMLNRKLKYCGVYLWESYMVWAGIVLALVLIFALNATNTGTTAVVQQLGVALCYKQQYVPVALTTALVLVFLELYAIGRFVSMAVFRPQWLSTRSITTNFTRATSLLVLELLTVVPSVTNLNVLADFIPFSIAATIVLAAFNRMQSDALLKAPAPQPLDHASDTGSVYGINRTSHHTARAPFTPRPFMLRFLSNDQPSNDLEFPRTSILETEGNDSSRFVTLHPVDAEDVPAVIQASRRHSHAIPPVPRSAPAKLGDPQAFSRYSAHHILPFQAEVAEQFDREEDELSGPVVRPPRSRPRVFVMVDEEESLGAIKTPASNVFGSDIIRLTPRMPRKKRHTPISPESAAFSQNYSASHRPSYMSTQESWRDSFLSAYTYQKSPDGMSPRDSFRPMSWRAAPMPRSSFGGLRERASEQPELPTVLEKTQLATEIPPSVRIRSKRRIFGQHQSFRYAPQDMIQMLRSPEPHPRSLPVSIPDSSPSPLMPMLQRPPDADVGRGQVPQIPASPSVAPVIGTGRGRGRDAYERPLGLLKGPRPPPSPLSPPSLDEWRDPSEQLSE